MESIDSSLPPPTLDDPVRARVIFDAMGSDREILPPVDEHLDRSAPVQTLAVSLAARGEVVCVRPDLSVEALLTLLLDRGISGVPVVDEECRPVGMVSKTDLLRRHRDEEQTGHLEPLTAEQERELRARFGPGYHLLTIARATVRDVMMPVAMTLDESAPVARAAALMVYEGIHRLPVVDASGRVTGILTPLDILRLLAKATGYVLT